MCASLTLSAKRAFVSFLRIIGCCGCCYSQLTPSDALCGVCSYIQSIRVDDTLNSKFTDDVHRVIFCNVEEILAVHKNLVADLEVRCMCVLRTPYIACLCVCACSFLWC